MSAGFRADPNGGKLYFQIDGVDVAELDPSDLTIDGNALAKLNEVAQLSGATFTGGVEIDNSVLTSDRNTGKSLSNIDSTDNSGDAWNADDNTSVKFENNNNLLAILVGGAMNNRDALLQVGHRQHEYASFLGDLWLNPFGGSVTIGGNEVAEYGSNSNGEYMRLYDGTQICWYGGDLPYAGSYGQYNWNYPAGFSSNPGFAGGFTTYQAGGDIRDRAWFIPHTIQDIRVRGIIYPYNASSRSDVLTVDPIPVSMCAIGRWK